VLDAGLSIAEQAQPTTKTHTIKQNVTAHSVSGSADCELDTVPCPALQFQPLSALQQQKSYGNTHTLGQSSEVLSKLE